MTGDGGEPWAAVDAFLAFVLRREPTTRDDWRELARLLDRLALARHACPAPDPGDDGDPAEAPRATDADLRAVLGPRFPEFGYYRSVEPVFGYGEDPGQPSCLGDAIDDLLDITHELQEAKWFREQRSDAVGAALLAWSFDAHWGQHLRELQLYLHCMLRG